MILQDRCEIVDKHHALHAACGYVDNVERNHEISRETIRYIIC
jgi:hypothetical protein